jgi:tRNA U55 pseudouridine synthase TruB
MYSALKISGTPLYKLARKGIDVQRKPRGVQIYDLKLVRFDPPLVGLDVTCSSGTYVRTLAADLAETLGTCGHVCGLTRTAVGPFTVEDAVRLEPAAALGEKFISLDTALGHLDETSLAADELRMLLNGITLNGITPNGITLNGITPNGAAPNAAEPKKETGTAESDPAVTPRFLRVKDREGALVCIASAVGGDVKMVTPLTFFDKYLKQSFR